MRRAVHAVAAVTSALGPGSLIPDLSDPGFWTTVGIEIVVFLSLLATLRVIVFRPLLRVLEARDRAIEGAIPFMSNGCPEERTGLVSCTRPFGSYRPSEPFRDYPFVPTKGDLGDIRRQLRLDRWIRDN